MFAKCRRRISISTIFRWHVIAKKKFDCIDCDTAFNQGESIISHYTEDLIYARNFSKDKLCLKNPSDKFFEICNIFYETFANNFEKYAHRKELCKFIIEKCVKETTEKYPDWFNDGHICYTHRMEILKTLITILTRKKTRWLYQENYTLTKPTKHEPAAKKLNIMRH